MATIALDAMGSDAGADVTVPGAAAISLQKSAPEILLVGDEGVIRRLLLTHKHDPSKIRVVHTPYSVAMDESPKEALDAKPEASVLVAARLVREGAAEVLVSAGNTGAVTLACARTFERLPGVGRCALGAVYPTERRRGTKNDPFSLILDAGLTLDPRAEDLVAFALMGSAYAARISSNAEPLVALLSNGTEPSKGTAAVVEAHRRLTALSEQGVLRFIGNIEGTDIPRGTADVVVTGGFSGNIVLKMLEGIAETMLRLGRYAGDKSLRYKAGLALLAPAVRKLRRATDWEQYGGVPILGFDHVCIKAHGRSTARAIANAVRVAHKTAKSDLVGSMRAALAATEAATETS